MAVHYNNGWKKFVGQICGSRLLKMSKELWALTKGGGGGNVRGRVLLRKNRSFETRMGKMKIELAFFQSITRG